MSDSRHDLRQRAEARLARTQEASVDAADLQRLVHELRVHQIELEMQNEELQAARDAAEAANVAKSRFLATMSHEIRTPLNGVLGMAQLLLAYDVGTNERLEYTRTIIHCGETLLRLLNDILDLSKVEAGRMQLCTAPFSAAVVLMDIQTLFSEPARMKGLELQAHWMGDTQQHYRGDMQRLLQMLSNLVSNAIKFTTHGTVHVEGREIARDAMGAMLEFTVTDTGVGIAPEHSSLLFKPFSQLDTAPTRAHAGSGLGLSIIRSLAHLMGGEVGFGSVPGQGSRFWFRVRVSCLEPGEDVREKPRDNGGIREQFTGRVLVVEDVPANILVISSLLRKLGLEVFVTKDGRQGVAALTGGAAIDLVLMDIQLPVMDGYEATRQIRQWERDNGKPALPIIALTADAYEEDHQRCTAAGMDDFLTKPVNIHQLAAVLARNLARGTSR